MENIDNLLILFLVVLLINNATLYLFFNSDKREREKLTKMLAARDYSEYQSHETVGEIKAKTSKHQNMVKNQQDKLNKRQLE